MATDIKQAWVPDPGEDFQGKSAAADREAASPSSAPPVDYEAPQVITRQVVATLAKGGGIWAAPGRSSSGAGYFSALRRAFLGDGLAANWTILAGTVPTFTPILDFIHLLSYILRGRVRRTESEHGTTHLSVMGQMPVMDSVGLELTDAELTAAPPPTAGRIEAGRAR